jgi:hypothetical protein
VSNVRALLAVSLLALAGCRARQTGPDANYEKGARIYQQLYAAQLDDAYGDPKMNEAAELLKKVDPRSVDAESAQRMLASIDSGRALLQKQQAARNKMAQAAAASLVNQQRTIDPQKIIAASAPMELAKPDAGPEVDPYGPGASINELNSTSGGCLIAGEPFRERETNVTGRVYRIGKAPQCADRLPGLSGQVVLVGADGRIYRRLADPTPSSPSADAGVAAAPVAVAPPVAAATPKPSPPPAPAAAQPSGDSAADADAGVAGFYLPGMPIPDQLQQPQPPPPADQQQ